MLIGVGDSGYNYAALASGVFRSRSALQRRLQRKMELSFRQSGASGLGSDEWRYTGEIETLILQRGLGSVGQIHATVADLRYSVIKL
jgi:hypothetical protein